MSNAVTVPEGFRLRIAEMRPEIERLLAGGVQPDRFERAVVAAVENNPKLLDLPPDSFLGACKKAAADRLVPDGREGAIVPRWNSQTRRNEAAWQPMVRGIVKVAKLYAGVKSITCELVYEGEPFRMLLGDEVRIEHERRPELVIPGKEIGCYAVFCYGPASHERDREFMTRAQIEAIRERAKKGDRQTPWDTDWGEMARKTLIHRLAKKMAASDDAGESLLQQVVGRIEEEYDFTRKGDGRAAAEQGQQPARQPAQPRSGPAGAFHAAMGQRPVRDVDPATGEVAPQQAEPAPAAPQQAAPAAASSAPPPASHPDVPLTEAAPAAAPAAPGVDPLFVSLVSKADNSGPNWKLWGEAMKAHLANCQTVAEVKHLNEVNREALGILAKVQPKSFKAWMTDSCGARVTEIEDAASPPKPAEAGPGWSQQAA